MVLVMMNRCVYASLCPSEATTRGFELEAQLGKNTPTRRLPRRREGEKKRWGRGCGVRWVRSPLQGLGDFRDGLPRALP